MKIYKIILLALAVILIASCLPEFHLTSLKGTLVYPSIIHATHGSVVDSSEAPTGLIPSNATVQYSVTNHFIHQGITVNEFNGKLFIHDTVRRGTYTDTVTALSYDKFIGSKTAIVNILVK